MLALRRPPFADPAAEAAKLLCRLALIILMILTPIAEIFFHGVLYVLLPVGAGVLAIAGGLSGGVQNWRNLVAALRSPIGMASLFLALWCGLSLIWTPFPGEAGARFAKTLGTGIVVLLAIVVLPERTKASNLYLLPIGLALTALGTFVMVLFGPASFWLGPDLDSTLAQRSIMSITILLWPALGALALREHWLVAAGLAVAVTVATLAAFSQVALVAIAVAALVYVIAVSSAARTGEALGFFLPMLVFAAPFLALLAVPLTTLAHWPHAGALLAFADVIGAQWPRLITGHGLGLAAQALQLGVLPPDTPRSIIFVLWYELGLLGAIAFAILGARVFLAAGQTSPYVAPPLLAGLIAGLLISLWGAETTQLWWMTLGGLDAIAFALLFKGHPRAKRPLAPPGDEEPEDAPKPAEEQKPGSPRV